MRAELLALQRSEKYSVEISRASRGELNCTETAVLFNDELFMVGRSKWHTEPAAATDCIRRDSDTTDNSGRGTL